MATTTLSADADADEFSALHANAIVGHLEAARVILRTVLLALCAEDSGSVSHAGNVGASRWSAAIGAVLTRLGCVRDTLLETVAAPSVDWFTSFALASALDSALWEGHCTSEPVLSLDETKTAIQVLIDSLDDMLRDCEAQGGAGAMLADKAGIQ